MINKNINADYCLTKTAVNNQNMISCSLIYAFQNSFPSIRYNCTTTKEIENIMSFKLSNPFGYGEVPAKILKLYSFFISFLLNYMCSRNPFTGLFPDRLKYTIKISLFKKSNENYVSNYRLISILTTFSKIFENVMLTRLLKHLTS
jgi:Notch-like protein